MRIEESEQLNPEVHHKYICGVHVAVYMRTSMEDELAKYQFHFSEYIKKGIKADDIEALYKKVHATIQVDLTIKESKK
ncbi:hypothetical protein SLEP1_g10941 [Rubroshorea leprosula]|uniref:60S ribosomal protein L5 n=1 Tax=Rubroshorea leprosula TaxID=152421 RepID=A0AAV5IJQ5_9ROSI|nr:hypothetical protein SLEP1_g10941 [Rubroshorea leprosula]